MGGTRTPPCGETALRAGLGIERGYMRHWTERGQEGRAGGGGLGGGGGYIGSGNWKQEKGRAPCGDCSVLDRRTGAGVEARDGVRLAERHRRTGCRLGRWEEEEWTGAAAGAEARSHSSAYVCPPPCLDASPPQRPGL